MKNTSYRFKTAFATVLLGAIACHSCGAQTPSSLKWPDVPVELGRRVAPIAGPVLGPEAVLPKDDTVQVLNTSERFKGLLTYSAVITNNYDNDVTSLVLRGIGFQRLLGNKPTSAVQYGVNELEGRFFDPQWAPDGKILSYKSGDRIFEFGHSQLFLWDLVAGNRSLVTRQYLSFPSTYWSPDSCSLAYFIGGDIYGDTARTGGQVELFTYDRDTKKERKLAINPLIKHPLGGRGAIPLAWTTARTLLYVKNHVMSQRTSDKIQGQSPIHAVGLQSDIYEVAAATGKTNLLIVDGFSPAPSPDNQWIAFLGHKENFSSPQYRHHEIGVCLFHRPTRKRIWLHPLKTKTHDLRRGYGEKFEILVFPAIHMRWSNDSRRFVIVESSLETYNATTKLTPGHAKILAWKIGTVSAGTALEVATLSAPLPAASAASPTQFVPFQISRDGSALYLEKREYTHQIVPATDNSYSDQTKDQYEEVKTLLAVDLNNGQTFDIARMSNRTNFYGDWDWLETSP